LLHVPAISCVDVDDGGEAEGEDFDAQECMDDFILTLPADIRKMMSIVIMKSLMDRQKYGQVQAATEAASMMGFSDKSVHKYMRQFKKIRETSPQVGKGSTKE
jgi:hypothetical protein